MSERTAQLVDLIHKLPERYLDEAIGAIKDIIVEKQSRKKPSSCPHCQSSYIWKNGHNRNKQRYRCMVCEKTFVETTGSIIHNSHFGDYIWRQAIKDTLAGVSITKSAHKLNITRPTARSMRKKILGVLDSKGISVPFRPGDYIKDIDVYILEGLKGEKTRESQKLGNTL